MTQQLHPRNPHAGRYDFTALSRACPALQRHLRPNPAGDQTIDFTQPDAVICLNQALLAHYYQVEHWQVPEGHLCPPIPGRADYIHHLADLLAIGSPGRVPTGKTVRVLDVGTGANVIYPILGSRSYGWSFVGTDINPVAVKAARLIVAANPCLTQRVKVLPQPHSSRIFRGIIQETDRYALTMCNPPFHASPEEAQIAGQRKRGNLAKGGAGTASPKPNFGGVEAELCCPGGEVGFLTRMMEESADFQEQAGWFTSLVSRSEHLSPLKRVLTRLGARNITVINMSQGRKQTRFIAWNFRGELDGEGIRMGSPQAETAARHS